MQQGPGSMLRAVCAGSATMVAGYPALPRPDTSEVASQAPKGGCGSPGWAAGMPGLSDGWTRETRVVGPGRGLCHKPVLQEEPHRLHSTRNEERDHLDILQVPMEKEVSSSKAPWALPVPKVFLGRVFTMVVCMYGTAGIPKSFFFFCSSHFSRPTSALSIDGLFASFGGVHRCG